MARLDRNLEPYSLLSPDRQPNGPSGGSNHITVFTEANVMQVKHNSEHSAFCGGKLSECVGIEWWQRML